MTDRRSKARAKRRSRFPEGMTERKAKANEEADPCGMTARTATARARAQTKATAKARPIAWWQLGVTLSTHDDDTVMNGAPGICGG
jgi:hypothetical protein